MEEWKEFSAKTADEALTNALIQMETTSDQIEYEVVEEEKSGILGLFSKPAVIRVRKKENVVDTVVSALQKKGYLLLEASEGDKREKRIVLTESGQVYAHRMIAPLRKAEEKVYRTIGNERLQAMCEILDLFNLLFERELRGGLGSE